MKTQLQTFWRSFVRWAQREEPTAPAPIAKPSRQLAGPALELAPNDPLIAYFQRAPYVVEIDKLDIPSPALRALRAAGVQVAIPLVSQGELTGLLNLGPRLSGQDYSADDRKLLEDLATHVTPALRVAQLVRQQQIEAQTRERIAQEMRIARLIQQTLLPKQVPEPPGWKLARYYQPAREVGGDFYDFLTLSDGRLGIVIGDVTDKGVPAALVMATTRAMLRAAAERLETPGPILERVNDALCPDIPPNMFVTCLYAILDPATGRLQYANAGHDLPYRRHASGVDELRATGMPLGLMPEMHYEEKEIMLEPGDSVLFYSDGLVEAHNRQREMFSFPRLQALVAAHPAGDGEALVAFLLAELAQFTGADWEQEDDITLVTLQWSAAAASPPSRPAEASAGVQLPIDVGEERDERPSSDRVTARAAAAAEHDRSSGGGQRDDGWRTLAEFRLLSEPGNERLAMEQVAAAVEALHIPTKRLERLKTAVAEATMNAMEHGNQYQPDLPVAIAVRAAASALSVRITDQGGSQPIAEPEQPDLDAKLEGTQTPRGWGLFLMKNLVDDLHITSDETHHTIELILYLEGDTYAHQST